MSLRILKTVPRTSSQHWDLPVDLPEVLHVGPADLWGHGAEAFRADLEAGTQPSDEAIEAVVADAAGRPLTLDLREYALRDPGIATSSYVRIGQIDRALARVVDRLRGAGHEAPIYEFNLGPLVKYKTVKRAEAARGSDWWNAADYLADLEDLARREARLWERYGAALGTCAPSGYPHSATDWDAWATVVRWAIKTARERHEGLPVYVWMSWRHLRYYEDEGYNLRPLPPELWRWQLEVVERAGADGVLLWDYQGGPEFGKDHPLVRVTMEHAEA